MKMKASDHARAVHLLRDMRFDADRISGFFRQYNSIPSVRFGVEEAIMGRINYALADLRNHIAHLRTIHDRRESP